MLRDAGIDCVLLERDAHAAGLDRAVLGLHPGRRHARCSARPACSTTAPTRFAADIQAKAHGTAAPHLVAAYTEAIAPALDALQQRHGLHFELLDGFLYPGHSVRAHAHAAAAHRRRAGGGAARPRPRAPARCW